MQEQYAVDENLAGTENAAQVSDYSGYQFIQNVGLK